MKFIKKIKLVDVLCLYIILCPILDMTSFIYRNYFNTSFSPSTIIRPIIPTILFVILFFKEPNKLKKIGVGAIYGIYAIIHLLIFQKLHNGCSYGNIKNEIQYIINYSLMIINLYLIVRIINSENKKKINKYVFISLAIYVLTLFFSIITRTSSSTYLEGIGYKGYFESGNSLCTVLLLSICLIIGNINKKSYKEIITIVLAGLYLCAFSGMRTGLFGFALIIVFYGFINIIMLATKKEKVSKKMILIISIGIIIILAIVGIFGTKTLKRRALLKQQEEINIDKDTNEKRNVTGDILDIYKSIENGNIEENYMTDAEKNAIVDLYNYAKKVDLSSVNLRKQQFIYNVFLVKEQKNILLILFGNGYKNQTGELVMEMEVPALLINFGLFGFILYFGPFLFIFVKGLYYGIKNLKNLKIEFFMYLFGMALAIGLSTFSGYVFFNFSSMTFAILLSTLILKNEQ